MHVRKFILLFTFLTSTFVYTSFVQADGVHSNNNAEVSNAITNFRGNEQQSPDENAHSKMDHGDKGDEQANMHNGDHATIPQSESGHSDSDHGEEGYGDVIEDTPPNYKVLGTFGAINLGFLSLGVILKIRKRKDSPHAVK